MINFSSEDQRYDYPGTRHGDVVLDVGLHRGDFSRWFYDKYGCVIYAFEPIASFRDQAVMNLGERVRVYQPYDETPGVRVFGYGLSSRDEHLFCKVRGDATSLLVRGDEQVTVRPVDRVLDELHVGWVKLIKLNCEGCEYFILRRILDAGIVLCFENIQVQWHRDLAAIPDCDALRTGLEAELMKTHERTLTGAHENWRRRPL